MKGLKSERGSGFADTLLSLSVVCALAVFVMPHFLAPGGSPISPDQKQQVLSDLEQIRQAIVKLEKETGVLTGYPGPNPCVNGAEHLIERECRLGLFCTDGAYPNWTGPYLSMDRRDPWGKSYYIDNDYYQGSQVSRVIGSMGPNGEQDSWESGDDIVLVLCRRGDR